MKAVFGWMTVAVLMMLTISADARQPAVGIDPKALIEQIVSVAKRQREQIKDVVFETEFFSGENDNNTSQVESRFVKKVYLKFFDDTTWFHQEYLEYYKNGKLQSPEKRDKKAAEIIKKNHKRQAGDISRSVLLPFYPELKKNYDITYDGVTEDKIDGYICHKFTVHSKVEEQSYINGDFFFEAETFHLVRVDFTPTKLTQSLSYSLRTLDISIRYDSSPDGFWFPRQIDIKGKGKTSFLFGVEFATTEYLRNPKINTNLSNELFEVDYDK
ncbi:MAG: hypothetical protein U9N55_08785 [candidate division Zixibacteria bacterium]|nr:hypothetical protein [candidate division Zixibacteria bacterium]